MSAELQSSLSVALRIGEAEALLPEQQVNAEANLSDKGGGTEVRQQSLAVIVIGRRTKQQTAGTNLSQPIPPPPIEVELRGGEPGTVQHH